MTIVAIGDQGMGDDGIGPHLAGLVRERQEAGAWPAGTEVLSADPMTAVSCAAEGKPVLVIDAANLGLEPGDWRTVSAREVREDAARVGSTHSVSLAQAMQVAEALGCEDCLRVLAVQWGSVERGTSLTEPVLARVPALLDWIKEEAERWP